MANVIQLTPVPDARRPFHANGDIDGINFGLVIVDVGVEDYATLRFQRTTGNTPPSTFVGCSSDVEGLILTVNNMEVNEDRQYPVCVNF